MTRSCGDCQLCCKLLPVREIAKLANTRCQHQKHGKGCGVYNTRNMPPSCKLWNCRWLVEDRSEDLRRPDRAGYVIDIMPDFITMEMDDTGEQHHIPVLQIWVDPARPNAWRADADLKAYIAKLGEEDGMAALIRNGSSDAVFLAPPAITADGTWVERGSNNTGMTRRPDDFLKAGFNMEMVIDPKVPVRLK